MRLLLRGKPILLGPADRLPRLVGQQCWWMDQRSPQAERLLRKTSRLLRWAERLLQSAERLLRWAKSILRPADRLPRTG
jgi:hypothetical protein